MNDYFIGVDRDGQPYIAHAWGRANGAHKYIAKIGEGAKARYFYTQEELRAFQQGGRQKAQNAVNKAKDKVGINQRSQFKNAQNTAMKTGHGSDWDKANDARSAYEKTALGKAENKLYKTKSKVENKAWDAVNKAKTTTDRMKEEFRKKDNKKLDSEREIKEEVIKEKTIPEKKIEEKVIPEKKIQEKHITDNKKSTFSEYTKGDSDFDDKNFDEKNRVGDSDFFMAKRPDGSTVILEEDMKWVIPKGVNPNDPTIKSALTKEYNAGSNDEWVKQVTEAIDDAIEKEQSKYPSEANVRKSKTNK